MHPDMIITIFLKRYYFGTIMNCKKSLFMACWAAMAATAQAQITIDIDAQQRSPSSEVGSQRRYGGEYAPAAHNHSSRRATTLDS